jgi:copper transport protein
MAPPRPRARRALLRALLLLAALALPTLARAHGALRAAVPRSGARLAVLPRDLRLTFSEAVELAVARLALTGPDGRPVPLSPVRRGASAAVIVADIVADGTGGSALQAGVYTVVWQIAGRDGHPVRGSYRFTILPAAVAAARDSAERSPAPDTAAHGASLPDSAMERMAERAAARAAGGTLDVESPLYVLARWLDLAGLLGLVGTAAFGLVVLPGAERRALPEQVTGQAARRARTLGVGAAALLAVASLLRLAAQSAAVNGAGPSLDGTSILSLVTGTTWGIGWSLQLGAALVALAALALAGRRPTRAWLPVAACAVAAAVGATFSGHAMAEEHHPALAFAADALHVLAAGGWAGTLLLLAGAALPAVRRATDRGPARVAAAASLVSAFSPWALACAAVAAATGTTSAWLHLGAPTALWSTAYGRTLLVKLALLVPAAVAGAGNWRRVRPALVAGTDATAELSRSVAVELLAAAAVLAVTAILVALSPP